MPTGFGFARGRLRPAALSPLLPGCLVRANMHTRPPACPAARTPAHPPARTPARTHASPYIHRFDTFYKLIVRFPAQTHPDPETAKQLSKASAECKFFIALYTTVSEHNDRER